MKAGDLRQVISIETKTVTGVGDRGQPTYSYGNAVEVFAKVEDLSGRKLELARQLVPSAIAKVTIRYLDTLSVGDRVVFGAEKLYIGAVLNLLNCNFTQEILCSRTPDQ